MKKIIIMIFLMFSVLLSFSIETFNTLNKIQKDINIEKERLVTLREKISREKIPLSKEILNLTEKVSKERENYKFEKMLVVQSEGNFEELERNVMELEEEVSFIYSLMDEYMNNIPKNRNLSDVIRDQDQIKRINTLIESEHENVRFSALEEILENSNKYTNEKIGANIFNGEASDNNGEVYKGKFINNGPLDIFISSDKSITGITLTSNNNLLPVVKKTTSIDEENSFFYVPVDVTMGGVLKTEKLQRGFSQEMKKGGYIIYPILILGMICIITIILKIRSFWNIDLDKEKEVEEIIRHITEKNISNAYTEAKRLGNPLSPVILEGIHHREASKEEIEEIMTERIMFQIPFLQKNLTILAVAAAASPLLGLLGTVTGMIHTFNLVTLFGSGKAGMLSSGISEALITTKYGLVVAIPALLMHAYFSRKSKKIINRLDQLSLAFINGLKIKGRCER